MNTTATFSNSSPADTVGGLIAAYQAESGVTDDQLAIWLGYPKGNVIAMFRRGAMRFPWGKVDALAALIEVDPDRVLELALQDGDPDLLQLIRTMKARCKITPAEQRLLEHCRTLAGGRDVSPFIIDGRSVVALVVR